MQYAALSANHQVVDLRQESSSSSSSSFFVLDPGEMGEGRSSTNLDDESEDDLRHAMGAGWFFTPGVDAGMLLAEPAARRGWGPGMCCSRHL